MNEVSATLPAGNNVVTLNGSRTFRLYSDQSTIDGHLFKINQQVLITAIDAAGPTMTTDGGSWLGADGTGVAGDGRFEPSQQWTTNVTNELSTSPATNAFNSVISSSGWRADAATSVLTFVTPIDIVGKTVEAVGAATAADISMNGIPISGWNGSISDLTWINVTSQLSGQNTLNTIEVYVSPDLPTFQALRIDGKLLVDSSVPGGPGKTTVDKNTAYAGQLTVASDSKLAQITGGVYMTDGTFKTDGSGEYAPADYTLQTSTIASVVNGSVPSYTSNVDENVNNAYDGNWTTTAYYRAGIPLTVTFANAIVKPNHSVYTLIGKNSGDTASVVLTTSVGTTTFDPANGGSAIYKIYTNNTASDVTLINADHYRAGATSAYLNAYAIVPDSAGIGDSIPQNDGNTLLPEYTFFIQTPPVFLTFNTPNPDLQYFEVGDVVNEAPSYITPTVDRLTESQQYTNSYNGNNQIGGSLNMSNFFGLDYNTGGIVGIKNNLQTFRVGMVLTQHEFVDDDIWTKKPVKTNIDYKYAYVRFVMPDGTTQEVRSGLSSTGPAGETGGAGWFVIRNRPSNFIDLCYIEFNNQISGSVSNVPYYGWAIGTRGITTEPYTLAPVSITAIDTTANTMTVSGGTWAAGGVVSYGPVTGTGTIVDKTTASPWEVSLNPVGGRWIGPNKAGTNFKFAPVIPVVDTATTVYCKMQVIDDKAEVMGIQTTDPGFLSVTKQNYDIQFPALFTDGDAPDTALPLGTELTATVKAENAKGDSVRESNTVMPLALNPADSAGPITATEGGWNQSQVWSAGVSASAAVYTGTPVNAFDGNETTEYGLMQGSGSPRTTVTFNLTGLVSPRIKIKNPVSSSNFVITTNQGDQSISTYADLTWVTLPVGTTSIIKTEATGGAGSQVVAVSAIESNGRLLVDTGITGDTSQILTLGNAANLNTFVANDALKMVDDTGAVASYIPVTSTIANVDSGGVVGANPAGRTVYYGELTADCKNVDGSLSAKNFVVPTINPSFAFNGNTAGNNRAEATGGNGIDIIIPDGIGSLATGASVYSTTANGIMIAVNGDFANALEWYIYPSSSGWFDLSISPAFQREGKLYRVTIYNSSGTGSTLGVTGISGTSTGGDVFTSGNYGTATGFIVPSSTTLTFSTPNPDLQYFQVGDVVQEVLPDGDPPIPTSISKIHLRWNGEGTPSAAIYNLSFDGSTTPLIASSTKTGSWLLTGQDFPTDSDLANCASNASTSETITATYATPITCNGVVKMETSTGGSKTVSIKFNDEPDSSYRNFTVAGSQSWNVEISNPSSYASITGIDVATNTMVVDDGAWTGSDGTSSGDAADRETVVTGPAKSGTGAFLSTNGTNLMSITNSNLQWISNDNRLSQDFYVQPLVTRLNKDNPAHVALQQAIVTAFSTVKTNSSPALTGDLYRLLAGETLTAAEIATLTDRLTAATHGDRPFHLDGYYPLYYTAVGANAASPTSSSHTHLLGGNTYYMPDGVTIYHGTYVPTVEAYTVLPHISTNPTTTTTTTTNTSSSSSSSSSGGGSPGGGGGY